MDTYIEYIREIEEAIANLPLTDAEREVLEQCVAELRRALEKLRRTMGDA